MAAAQKAAITEQGLRNEIASLQESVHAARYCSRCLSATHGCSSCDPVSPLSIELVHRLDTAS